MVRQVYNREKYPNTQLGSKILKHISEQEWGHVGVQFPKQFQNISGQRVLYGHTGQSCRESCADVEARRSHYQSKCFSLVVELVSSFFEVSVESLQGRTRGIAPICQARQICMYLLHTSFSISYPEIGQLFRRDRTTISHACMVVEDLRDDCAIDSNLTRLESILETIRSLHGGTGFPILGEVQ